MSDRVRRKSTTSLYKNMTVSKALAVLKISEREFRELSERDFRSFGKVLGIVNYNSLNSRVAFTRRNSIISSNNNDPPIVQVEKESAKRKERKSSTEKDSTKPVRGRDSFMFIDAENISIDNTTFVSRT